MPCVILTAQLFDGSNCKEGSHQNEQVDAMQLVTAAEESAEHYGFEPSSLLLVDLGKVLTRGAFQAESSLLSLRPAPLRKQLALTESKTHTELIEALAAPLKVILITSQDELARSKHFYSTDFNQNVRHKFLFLVLTKTKTQLAAYRPLSDRFQVRTLIWSENKMKRFSCVTEHDNIFTERSKHPIGTCERNARKFKVIRVRTVVFSMAGKYRLSFQLPVKCNSTIFVNHFNLVDVSNRQDPRYYDLAARWSIFKIEAKECYSYILLSNVDVTALAKPFEFEV